MSKNMMTMKTNTVYRITSKFHRRVSFRQKSQYPIGLQLRYFGENSDGEMCFTSERNPIEIILLHKSMLDCLEKVS